MSYLSVTRHQTMN